MLVLHVEHPRDATPASIGTILNLASTFIRIRHVDELPRLSNGKVDYADLSSFNQPVSSPWADPTRFLTDVAREFLAILLGVGVTHQSVQATFAEILGVPEIQPSDSFASLGGDSMSYVECTVFLESVLSDVPRDWHLLDIRTLESMRGGTL